MGKINSRAKGASAERELIKELGGYLGDVQLKRNLEQTRAGGHDILGLEGFAIEVKRYKALTEAMLDGFWDQAVEQADRVGARPVLAYREDFRSWRVRVQLCDLAEWADRAWTTGGWTADLSLEAFAALVREHRRCALHSTESPPTLPSHSEEACASAR